MNVYHVYVELNPIYVRGETYKSWKQNLELLLRLNVWIQWCEFQLRITEGDANPK